MMRTSFSRDAQRSAGVGPASRRSNAPLRVAAKRRATVLPQAGRYFLLVALVLLGIAVLRRINLLILLADALLVMALLNVLAAGRSVRGLRARRRFAEWLIARTP